MLILLKDNSEILMPDNKSKDAWTPRQVAGNATKKPTKGSWHTVTSDTFLAITPLALNMKTWAVVVPYPQTTYASLLHSPQVPNSNNKGSGTRSFLRDCYILQRYEKLFQMSFMWYNIWKASVEKSHARV